MLLGHDLADLVGFVLTLKLMLKILNVKVLACTQNPQTLRNLLNVV